MRRSQIDKPPLGSQINWKHPLARGLAGCWLMNEGSGGSILDYSNGRRRGTISGMDGATGGWFNSQTGPYLLFDGSNDYIDCGHVPELEAGGDISFVFRINPVVLGTKMICQQFDTTPSRGWIIYANVTGGVIFQSGGTDFISLNGTIVAGTWTHIVLTNRSGYSSCYKDGKLLSGPTAKAVTANTTASSFTIGGPTEAGIGYFNMSMSHMSIYNRALSPWEITQLYQSPYAIFERRPVWMDYVAPPAGGLSIPVAMHHYMHH